MRGIHCPIGLASDRRLTSLVGDDQKLDFARIVLALFLSVLTDPDSLRVLPMCNLYSQTKSQDAVRRIFVDEVLEDEVEALTGNLPSQPGIYSDYSAPILRHDASGGWQLVKARWGMPTLGKG